MHWRLPSIVELQSLIDYDVWNPAVLYNPFVTLILPPIYNQFGGVLFSYAGHWSSTTRADAPGYEYWAVNFLVGSNEAPDLYEYLNVLYVHDHSGYER